MDRFWLTLQHMGWILSYPPVKAVHQAASWTEPVGTVSEWCTGCIKPIHTEPQTGSISGPPELPGVYCGDNLYNRNQKSAAALLELRISVYILLFFKILLSELNTLNYYVLQSEGNQLIKYSNLFCVFRNEFPAWGCEGLLWRRTMPVFLSHWTWTSQIQLPPSHETLRKKSLFCRCH